MSNHYDWIVIGSGFGGSVSALRLAEKGYRVLVIEKGKRFGKSDFPKTNWDLKRWMWMPGGGMQGIFQMSFFEHVTILHGVGVGGGSLTYANTLPTPKKAFFEAPSWAHLGDWERELAPHYSTAERMLGAVPFERVTPADRIMKEIARDIGREDQFHPTRVGVYFGEPNKEVPDPFFGGKGPRRTGCTFCGACMTGCRVGAKNTLDQNYLYLAQGLGCEVRSETEVTAVREQRGGGYRVEARPSIGRPRTPVAFTADRVIFAGGVLGSLPLLLRMQEDPEGLPRLSPTLGYGVRTNSESLIGVVAPDVQEDLTEGVAITSILHTDEHSHIEPVRYGHGSGFFRTMALPHAPGDTLIARLARAATDVARNPGLWARVYAVRDFSQKSQTLLYMRTLDGTMRFKLGRSRFTAFRRGLVSEITDPAGAPKAFMDEATDLANRFASKVNGVAISLATELALGTPSTAHILGGCVMGANADEGVINADHEVFGYDGLYVIDGAAMSANPGVNPSLTITALAERAMAKIPARA